MCKCRFQTDNVLFSWSLPLIIRLKFIDWLKNRLEVIDSSWRDLIDIHFHWMLCYRYWSTGTVRHATRGAHGGGERLRPDTGTSGRLPLEVPAAGLLVPLLHAAARSSSRRGAPPLRAVVVRPHWPRARHAGRLRHRLCKRHNRIEHLCTPIILYCTGKCCICTVLYSYSWLFRHFLYLYLNMCFPLYCLIWALAGVRRRRGRIGSDSLLPAAAPAHHIDAAADDAAEARRGLPALVCARDARGSRPRVHLSRRQPHHSARRALVLVRLLGFFLHSLSNTVFCWIADICSEKYCL